MDLQEQFGPLLGNWTGVEEQAASPWAPATSARAMLVFLLDVQDRVVLQDYRQVREDGAEFSGHGVFLAGPDETVLWWFFDTYGAPPDPAPGRWEQGALTIDKVTPRGRAEHRFAVSGDELDYRIRLQLTGEPAPVTFLTGHYRRISGH